MRRVRSLLRALAATKALSGIVSNPVARVIVAFLVFAASVGGLTLTAYADQLANGGITWSRDIPDIPLARVDPMGVNLFLEKEVDPAKIERTLQMAEDGGFKWARQDFAWNDIEISAKGDYIDRRNPNNIVNAWDKYDRIVDAYQRHHIEIIARLDSPPVWARIPGDDVQTYHKGPPRDNNDYGDFVAAVVSRYKGKIKYFQIWNEPNLLGEWGGHPVDPEAYTALLEVAYARAKQANPDAVILTAALAPTAENTVANLNDILFLEGMYRAGAAQYFDILSTMLYGLGQSPEERRTDLNRLNFSRPILLRRVMEEFGDIHKPIWISEYAWISIPPDFSGDPSRNIWGKSVDEETQARWEVEGYERARSEWPWLGVMCVWYFREPDPHPEDPANYFAIVKPDFTPRPAYNALRAYAPQASPDWQPRQKPLGDLVGFPLLYGVFGLLAVASGALAGLNVGRWAQAALDRPRGRFSEAARETARNGAAVVGMALLAGAYYEVQSLPLIAACLALWWVLAFLKPSTGLGAVAFTIPFFWYPKTLGQQKFPIAETLLMLVFAAVIARGAVRFFLPSLGARLGVGGQGSGVGNRPAVPNPQSSVLSRQSSQRAYTTAPLAGAAEGDGRSLETVPPQRLLPRTVYAVHAAQPAAYVDRAVAVPPRDGRGLRSLPASYNPLAPEQKAQPDRTARPSLGANLPAAAYRAALAARFREWSREDVLAPPAVALLLVGTFSLLTLANPEFARDSLRAYRWAIVEPVLFFFLITDAIRTWRGMWRLVDFFVAGGAVVAMIGLWQFVQETNVLDVQGVSRVIGVYEHPNNLALYLERVAAPAACMAIFLPWSWRKLIYALASLPLLATLFLTFSRGAWLAIALALLAAVALALRWRAGRMASVMPGRRGWALAAAAVLLLAVAGALVYPYLPERIKTEGSGLLRIAIWKTAGHMLADHPLFGVGPDQFLNQFQGPYKRYYVNYVPDEKQQELFTSHPHDILLDWWLTLGIMGVIVLVWLLWRYFREVLVRIRMAAGRLGADRASRALALGLFAGMVAAVAHGLVDNSYFLMDLAMIFWLYCGLLQLLRSGVEEV